MKCSSEFEFKIRPDHVSTNKLKKKRLHTRFFRLGATDRHTNMSNV